MKVSYTIVTVSDMQRALYFYRDVLGLTLKFQSPQWTEFATEGATLALHAADAADREEPDAPSNGGGWCRPGLSVPNLREFHRQMVERNVTCIQEPKEVFGVPVAQYMDPDGLVFSVGEERRAK